MRLTRLLAHAVALSVSLAGAWPAPARDYVSLVAPVERNGFSRDLRALSSLNSRVTGYDGCSAAADYIERRFHQLGFGGRRGRMEVRRQTFSLPVPVDDGATLELLGGGPTYQLRALWPNLVRTSQIGPDGVRGEIIDAGRGALADFNGRQVSGALVLMDFNSGLNWLNAPLLGARAVIFVEPSDTVRSEAERKFVRQPVDVPRFWVSAEQAMELRARLAQGAVEGWLRAQMPWQNREAANVVVFLPGRDLPDEALVIEAYYDSVSVVPGLSPGAESALGMATLLQVAEALAASPPRRSVIFLATAGHFEALAGMREFIDVLGREPQRERERLGKLHELEAALEREEAAAQGEGASVRAAKQRAARLRRDLELHQRLLQYERFLPVVCLDLSSHGPRVGAFSTGWYYRQVHLLRFYSPLGRRLVEYAHEAAPALGVTVDQAFVDGINPVQGREWQTHFPDKVAFDHEMAVRGGRAGITLATVDDSRPLVGTPLDTFERVDLDYAVGQARLVACLLADLADDDTHDQGALKRLNALKKLDDLKPVRGSVLEFRREESLLPNTPVPRALVLVQGRYKTMMGVHTEVCCQVQEDGKFELLGEMEDPQAKLEAYGLDEQAGDITYAPDLGPDGEKRYPREVYGRAGLERPVIVFPCAPVAIWDLVDERYLETLQQLFVFDARDYSEPMSFGYSLPWPATSPEESGSYVEPCAVVYARPTLRVQMAMGMGLLGLRMVLTNGSPEAPEGRGFLAAGTSSIPLTPLQAARDMWTLDDWRMRELADRGIVNQRLAGLHTLAGAALRQAQQTLDADRYDACLAAARRAWALESRAYPDVQRTATDVVKGVLFYLAMLLPFAFFMERLLFACRDIKGQVVVTLAIFLVVFGALYLVHPAFHLPRFNPVIILLAFIIMALAVIVIAVVTTRFNEQLRQMRREESGIHQADVSRWSAVTAAFSLGIGNMRRRRTRTALTCLTLVLLTFTVLSLTSVTSYLRANKIRLSNAPPYPGLMIRDRSWLPLEEPTADIVANELGDLGMVAPRAWYISPDIEKPLYVDVTSQSGRTYQANALLGLSSAEPAVTGAQRALLPGSRWFAPGEEDACLLPASAATALGLTAQDLGRASVRVFGATLKVIGIVDEAALRRVTDLDGETITPVDYSMLRPEIIQELKRRAQLRSQIGPTSTQGLLQDYRHFPPQSMVIVPYSTVMSLGGALRSVAVRYNHPEAVADQVAKLMRRYALSIYAGIGRDTYLYSSVGLTALGGLRDLFVPILIAALIVLNAMLGSVYERVREISIFSSIGLAPIHVSMLFLAEASVFANIGAIVGYLLGQVAAKVVQATGALPGIELNYSSLSAVGVTAVVMVVVLASTVYPSRRAADIASPGLERKWRMPEPVGDEMTLVLPFTVTGQDAVASCAFLKEYFDEYVGYAGGEFLAEDVRLHPVQTPEGQAIGVSMHVWLAPYDLGVSQGFGLLAIPTGESEVYRIELHLRRAAGDVRSWVRTNSLFLSTLRKQYLIWRTLSPADRAEYAQHGRQLLHTAAGAPGHAAD